MDWEAVSAIGQIVGAAGVIVSLIYLASQVRGSMRSSRALLLQGIHAAGAQLQSTLMSDPSLSQCIRDGCVNYRSLDAAATARFDAFTSQLLNNYELYYMLNREIRFPRDVVEAHQRILRNRLAQPGMRSWWLDHRDTFSMDFVAWVDAVGDFGVSDVARKK